jgi:site-specific DNA-methyltransferase (adenine-specific)
MLYRGDNLDILRRHVETASVDLIYADPPFNSGKAYFHTERKAGAAEYDDKWRWTDHVAANLQSLISNLQSPICKSLSSLFSLIGPGADMAYLVFMAPRLAEMQRVLKPTGSLYLHCDVRMSHYLRLLLDAAFGRENFRNEIVWAYRTGGAGKRQFSRKHDVILFYSASKHYTFHPQYERVRYAKPFFSAQQDEQGYYADVLLRDVWEIPAVINVSKERTGYPTQKPIELLRRIIKASTNEGDLVLDPFCGSGTTLVAALALNRRALGVDANAEAIAIAKRRCEAVGQRDSEQ